MSSTKLKPLRILISSSGAPGCTNLIKNLKEITEREIYIVGVDASINSIGKFLSDEFYVIPKATASRYTHILKEIILKEHIDLFFCVGDSEVGIVSLRKDEIERECNCKVMVSDHLPILEATNKYVMYQQMKGIIPLPEYYKATTLTEFINAYNKIKNNGKDVCFKPCVSKGSRGFRIIKDDIDKSDLLFNHKPNNLYISFDEICDILNQRSFPDLLVMEHVEGTHYDAMALCHKQKSLLTTIKTRSQTRWGIITQGRLIESDEHNTIINKIVKKFDLDYNISIQFIDNKLIEINARTSSYIYPEIPEYSEPYLAIKLALGEFDFANLVEIKKHYPAGRSMLRFFDQVFY